MCDFKKVNVQEVKKLVDQGDITIVDIRDEGSYAEAHIQGAVLVNDMNIDDFISNADKNKPILCYCFHGLSSQSKANYFSENGFKTVYSMLGGFEGWRAEYLES